MISRWNYFSITIVMGVVLLMFQMTNVMLKQWNHYEENSFVRSWEELPSESSAYALNTTAAEENRGVVVYIGSESAPAFQIMQQWAVYTKQNFVSCGTMEEYQECGSKLAAYPGKVVSVHSEDLDWEDGEIGEILGQNAAADDSLVFCGLPESGAIKGNAGLRSLLGISRVRSEEVSVEGLRLEEGFLLGGGAEYRSVDPEENRQRQDMDLTFPWYILSEDTEIYMRGILEDESLELQEMPPVIWRSPVKEANIYAVNGDYMEEAHGLGLLSAMWADGKECEIYPVVNAQNLVAVNYPGLAPENSEEIQAIYGQDLERLLRDSVWPVFIAAYRQNTLGLTCMLAPQFDYKDENLPEQNQLLYYMKHLNEERAEVGLSDGRICGTPLEQKLLEDQWFMEGTLPDYQFTSFYSTEGENLEETLQNDILKPVRTVVSRYNGELEVFGYLNEYVTRQALLTDGVNYTYSQDFLTKCMETALGYTSVMVDMEKIAYPEGSDRLKEMSASLGWNLQNYFRSYENFAGTTVSESDERIRSFLALDYTKRIEGNTVYLELNNSETPAWFVLRSEGKGIQSVEGGQWTRLEDGSYLIETAGKNVVITLHNSTWR